MDQKLTGECVEEDDWKTYANCYTTGSIINGNGCVGANNESGNYTNFEVI